MAPMLTLKEKTKDQNTSLDSIKSEPTVISQEACPKDLKEEDPPLVLTDSYHEFKKILKPLGLKVKDVLGDGNCLFRALSDQLYGVEDHHAEIRQNVCDYLLEHEDHYSAFFFSEFETFQEHVSNMKLLSTYADNLELSAFANLYHADVHIFQTDRSDALVISGIPLNNEIPEPEETKRLLCIVYHSWEHYSSVSLLEDQTEPCHEEPKKDITPKELSPEPCLDDNVTLSLIKISPEFCLNVNSTALSKETSLLPEDFSTEAAAASLLSFDALFDKKASEGLVVSNGISTPLGSPLPSQNNLLELGTPTISSLTAPSGLQNHSREQSPEISTPTISLFSPRMSNSSSSSKVRKFVDDSENLPQCSKRRKFTHTSTGSQ